MSSYRAADSKREEFRRYLEKSGVLDALTKVLVGLYEETEKPSNALDFLKSQLSAGGPEGAELEALRREHSELQRICESLREEKRELQLKLAQYESVSEEGREE
uniref:C-Myc-binding protein n=1 Tax=Myxine glutinosa TaxID=7769 RepID=UPI00358FC941